MIGTTIHNYLVVRKIGEGGMGAVYLAQHPLIGRKAAIKVLHEEFARNPVVVGRFFNEARAANAIRHPNIIDVIDVGFLQGSERPYLMMEFLEGESLAQRLRRQPVLSPVQAVAIAHQTSLALAAAHSAGVVHRDLKPDNLFLAPSDKDGGEVVKVLDFGIAKLAAELRGDNAKTVTGSLLGTPKYMSPEQCRGAGVPIDARADIYSLGVILYHMLTGAPPFVTAGFGDILVMHITQPPEPLRSRNPKLPERLEAEVMRALAKQPEDRHPNMAAFAAALRAAVPEAASAPAPTSSSSALPRLTTMEPTRVESSPFEATIKRPSTAESTTLSRTAGQIAASGEKPAVKGPRLQRRTVFASLGALSALGLAAWLSARGPSDSVDSAAPSAAAPIHRPDVVPVGAPPKADAGVKTEAPTAVDAAAAAAAPAPAAQKPKRRPAAW